MNYALLQDKSLLLDSNVLIHYANYAPFFERMRSEWMGKNITPVLDELVRFEFLREAASPSEVNSLKEFLMTLFNLKLEDVDKSMFPIVPQETILSAALIANLYSWRVSNLKISLVDCFLAAQMKKYNEHRDQLMLATCDNTDFPPMLFERLGIETIDTNTKIINVGFYRFDREKYSKALADFNAQR